MRSTHWNSDGEPCHFEGAHVSLRGAVSRPIPQPKPHVIVGGRGLTRMPTLAARHADELNALLLTPKGLKQQHDALERACQQAGRDPSTITHSALCGYAVGATERDVRRRIVRTQSFLRDSRSGEEFEAYARENWVCGTPDDAAERIEDLQSRGVAKVVFHHLLHDDDEALALLTNEIAPRLT